TVSESRFCRKLMLPDELQLGGFAHNTRLAVLKNDHVHDALPPPARNVNTGLDGEDHVVFQHIVRCTGYAGRFVHLEAYAMAEAVPERLAVTGRVDHIVGDHVTLFARHSWLDHLLGCELSCQHDIVDLPEL